MRILNMPNQTEQQDTSEMLDEPKRWQKKIGVEWLSTTNHNVQVLLKVSVGIELRLIRSSYVLIELEDTGPGIPRRIRDRVFEPFVTAGKKNGLGLGLALSRQTVLNHGGDIWTEPAAGARFVIRLPLNRAGTSRKPLTGVLYAR
jgi:signal transduction histidine kinase